MHLQLHLHSWVCARFAAGIACVIALYGCGRVSLQWAGVGGGVV